MVSFETSKPCSGVSSFGLKFSCRWSSSFGRRPVGSLRLLRVCLGECYDRDLYTTLFRLKWVLNGGGSLAQNRVGKKTFCLLAGSRCVPRPMGLCIRFIHSSFIFWLSKSVFGRGVLIFQIEANTLAEQRVWSLLLC